MLVIDPRDDLAVALADLPAGMAVELNAAGPISLLQSVRAKHKFTLRDLDRGQRARMYGVTVGRTTARLPAGSAVTTENFAHDVESAGPSTEPYPWSPPALPAELPTNFEGYHRSGGEVGVANYWLVVPLVFCENRNVEVVREALETQLGFRQNIPRFDLSDLLDAHRAGRSLRDVPLSQGNGSSGGELLGRSPHFGHVDGLRFLTHEAGCGGTRADAQRLVRLLAGYLTHPNVGGATVLSLGCQNAQIALLREELAARGNPARLDGAAPGVAVGEVAGRPLVIAEQQAAATGGEGFLAAVIRQTVIGISAIDRLRRRGAPVDKLCLGLECGGSDGFSGITANPLLGQVSDWLVGRGARSLLAEFPEFPELHGVEADLLRRCRRPADAERFGHMMAIYGAAARRVGSGFADNPSPGNIREGLITDAMKSAGAARKGGTAPVSAVLDYGEVATEPGLHLLLTPGNDVESTTALAAAGAHIIAFTTGLGTPTGNPVAPTLKLASNSTLTREQPDLIDFDAGRIVGQRLAPARAAAEFWQLLIATASGRHVPRAVRLGQHDFIPWRRDLSL